MAKNAANSVCIPNIENMTFLMFWGLFMPSREYEFQSLVSLKTWLISHPKRRAVLATVKGVYLGRFDDMREALLADEDDFMPVSFRLDPQGPKPKRFDHITVTGSARIDSSQICKLSIMKYSLDWRSPFRWSKGEYRNLVAECGEVLLSASVEKHFRTVMLQQGYVDLSLSHNESAIKRCVQSLAISNQEDQAAITDMTQSTPRQLVMVATLTQKRKVFIAKPAQTQEVASRASNSTNSKYSPEIIAVAIGTDSASWANESQRILHLVLERWNSEGHYNSLFGRRFHSDGAAFSSLGQQEPIFATVEPSNSGIFGQGRLESHTIHWSDQIVVAQGHVEHYRQDLNVGFVRFALSNIISCILTARAMPWHAVRRRPSTAGSGQVRSN